MTKMPISHDTMPVMVIVNCLLDTNLNNLEDGPLGIPVRIILINVIGLGGQPNMDCRVPWLGSWTLKIEKGC